MQPFSKPGGRIVSSNPPTPTRLATPAARDTSPWLPRSRLRRLLALAVPIACLTASWFLLHDALSDIPSLPLLVVVGLTAAAGRSGPALIAAVASTIMLGWFTGQDATIGDREQAIALMAYLVVALALALAVPRAELAAASERRKATKSAFLGGASSALETAPDAREAMRRLARYVVPALADWCAVHVVDAHGRIEQIAVAHQDPEQEAMVEAIQRSLPLDPDAPTGVPNVVRTGLAEYYRDVGRSAAMENASPEARRVVADLGLRSAIIVPLIARGTTIGALTLVVAEADYLYEPEDVEFAGELASRVASTVQVLEARDEVERTSVRTAILERLASSLSRAITTDDVLGTVIDDGARELHADAALVALLSDDARDLGVVSQLGFGEDIIERWVAFPVAAALPLSEAVRERRCIWISTRDERDARYPSLAGLDLRADHATICVPMIAGADIVGGITFMLPTTVAASFEGEEAFFLAIAAQAGQALRRATLYDAQRKTARVLQDSLLPDRLPDIPGIEVAARYWSAEPHADVGGDFYDLIPIDDGALALVGDVCGRGVEAAAVMGMARHAAWAAADSESSPSGILERVNHVINRHVHGYRFVTMMAARISVTPDGAVVTVALGGHPPPIHVSEGSARPIGRLGSLLGVFDDIDVEDVTVQLSAGDTLVMYTDGIVERGRRHVPFELDEELISAVLTGRTVADSADAITTVVEGAGALDDDGAILLIGVGRRREVVPARDSAPA
jgi:GAF domain-containing protein